MLANKQRCQEPFWHISIFVVQTQNNYNEVQQGNWCPRHDFSNSQNKKALLTLGKCTTAVRVRRLFFATSTLFDAPNAIYTSLKSTFTGLQFRCWQYGSIFIHFAVIASETREMLRNSKRTWPYSSSRSSSSSILVSMESPLCDFLLVINCNFSHICYRFRDIHA